MSSVSVALLGDVAKFVRGITFKPDDVVPLEAEGAVACMRTKNVQTTIDLEDVWGIPREFVKRDDQILRTGDLLVSTANSWNLVGKCSWVPELPWPATLGGFISALRPDHDSLDPSYLYRWFSYGRTQALVRSCSRRTTNISNLSLDQCLALELPLPAIPEQRRIADILDKADALRAQRRAALAELDTLTQSIFLDLFGDPARNPLTFPTRRLGDLAAKFSDGPFGSNLKSSHYTESGVRVIRLQNIGVGEMRNDDQAFISEEHFNSLRKHECLPGDVLVGTLGDPNLRACIQPSTLAVALNKADCVQIRPDERIANAIYVCALLNQPGTESMAQDKIVGQTRLRISMGRLRELAVPVPPLELQEDFADRIAAVEALKARHRTGLAELDALFASLQHRAFTGAL